MITFRDIRHAAADAQYFYSQFVSQNPGITEKRLSAFKCMQVRTADSNTTDSYFGFAQSGLIRRWQIRPLKFAWLI